MHIGSGKGEKKMDIQLRKYLQSIKGIEQLQENVNERAHVGTHSKSITSRLGDAYDSGELEDKIKSMSGPAKKSLTNLANSLVDFYHTVGDIHQVDGRELEDKIDASPPRVRKMFAKLLGESVQLDEVNAEQLNEEILTFSFDSEKDRSKFVRDAKKLGIARRNGKYSGGQFDDGSMGYYVPMTVALKSGDDFMHPREIDAWIQHNRENPIPTEGHHTLKDLMKKYGGRFHFDDNPSHKESAMEKFYKDKGRIKNWEDVMATGVYDFFIKTGRDWVKGKPPQPGPSDESVQLGEAETPFRRKILSAQDKLRKAGIKSAFQFGEIYVENKDLKKAERLVGGDKDVIVLGVPHLRPDEIDENVKIMFKGFDKEVTDFQSKLKKFGYDKEYRKMMQNFKKHANSGDGFYVTMSDRGIGFDIHPVADMMMGPKIKKLGDSQDLGGGKTATLLAIKEDVQLDEATQHTVHVKTDRTGYRKLEAMIASLDGYKESEFEKEGKATFTFDAEKHDAAERKKVAEFIKKTRGAEFSHAMKEDVQLDERTYNIGPVTTYMFLEEALHDPEMTFSDFLFKANSGDKATRRFGDYFNGVDYMVKDEMMDNLRLFAEKAKSGDAYFVYRKDLKDTKRGNMGFNSAVMPFRGNPLGIKKLGDIAVGDDVTRELPRHMDYKFNRFVNPEDPREYNYTAMCVMIKD
jgi:hypothetical protein